MTSACKVLRWLTGLEWLAVVGAAPLLLFPTPRPALTVVALGALAALWLLRWAVRGEPWPVTPFNGALLLFALMVPVGMWASTFPGLTLSKAAGLVLGLAVLRSTAFVVQSRRTLCLALVALCLLGVAIVGVGAVAADWSGKVTALELVTDRIPRLIDSLPDMQTDAVNPNQIAGVLALTVPLTAALAAGWLLQRPRCALEPLLFPGWLVLLACTTGMLLLTQSRSGWIGGSAGLLTLGAIGGMSGRRRWQRVLGLASVVFVCAAALVGLGAVGTDRVADALCGTVEEGGAETIAGTISMAGRVEIWSRALYGIQDFPFTGCGLGAFRRVVHIFYPLFRVGPDTDVAHAHNTFLQTGLDLGVPGLVAYLALLVIAGVCCWRWAKQGHGLVRVAALGLAAGLVGLHAHGLTDALALGSKPGVLFWLALGVLASLERVDQEAIREIGEAGERDGLLAWGRARPLFAAILVVSLIALLGTATLLGWRGLLLLDELRGEPAVRLPLLPDALGAQVRLEQPPADSDWVGLLEVATYSTTHSIADVVLFYSAALADSVWHTEIEASDASGWSGIYWQDQGHSVCLLNAFDIEGEVWVSILCGDRSESLEVPPSSPPATPDAR